VFLPALAPCIRVDKFADAVCTTFILIVINSYVVKILTFLIVYEQSHPNYPSVITV